MVMLSEPWEVFVAGMAGPILVEMVKLYRLRGKRIQKRYQSLQYWLLTLPIIPLGGLTAWLQGPVMPLSIALQLGATAPLFIGAWASAVSHGESGLMPRPQSERLSALLGWR